MENSISIYHNPRCRKSRETLQLLEEKGVQPQIILYLQETPGPATIKELCQKLGISPFELIRKGEAIYKSDFKGKEFSDEEWYQILSENPKLIERPIVVKGDKAVIGRPPENVLGLV